MYRLLAQAEYIDKLQSQRHITYTFLYAPLLPQFEYTNTIASTDLIFSLRLEEEEPAYNSIRFGSRRG